MGRGNVGNQNPEALAKRIKPYFKGRAEGANAVAEARVSARITERMVLGEVGKRSAEQDLNTGFFGRIKARQSRENVARSPF